MHIDKNIFKTAKGLRPLMISEVNFEKRTFKFLRSTGSVSWSLSYDKFADLFEKAVGFMNYFIGKLQSEENE